MKSNQKIVSDALGTMTAKRQTLQPVPPRLDAMIAVVNADMIDRRAGLTLDAEDSPGLRIALRVRGAQS